MNDALLGGPAEMEEVQSARNILLVEDNDLQRQTLRLALEHFGFIVHEAANGLEATKVIASLKLDLIITDIVMPEKDGLQVIMEVRRSQPFLPILAMSGGGRQSADDYLMKAGELGADQGLAKPFSARELLAAVNNVLGVPA